MAAYCTLADLTGRFGQAELVQLAPDGSGLIDEARVARAIGDASDTIDGYLRVRYVLPLTAVPPLLTSLCIALARHHLYQGGDRTPTDQVTAARDQVIAFLKDVAAGRAELGIDAAGAAPLEDGPAVLAGAGAPRRLDEDALHDFMTGRR